LVVTADLVVQQEAVARAETAAAVAAVAARPVWWLFTQLLLTAEDQLLQTVFKQMVVMEEPGVRVQLPVQIKVAAAEVPEAEAGGFILCTTLLQDPLRQMLCKLKVELVALEELQLVLVLQEVMADLVVLVDESRSSKSQPLWDLKVLDLQGLQDLLQPVELVAPVALETTYK
jgi:hypothetical protein